MANNKKTAQDIVKPIKKTKKKKKDYKRIWKNIKKGCCKACGTISKKFRISSTMKKWGMISWTCVILLTLVFVIMYCQNPE